MEDIFMSDHSRFSRLFSALIFALLSLNINASDPPDSLILYTPYTKISVNPGEVIEYSVDVINNSSHVQDITIAVAGMPNGWNYSVKSNNFTLSQISILPDDRKNLTVRVEVPLKVRKGTYQFTILAGNSVKLPISVTVTSEGTFKTEFTCDITNQQGNSGSTFAFNAFLRNHTAEKQSYTFMAYAQRGWNITFKANYQAVTSVTVEPNASQSVSIEIKPPENVEAGTYKIPVNASTSSTSANLDLEMVITGNFKVDLSTPTGLVSTKITAGHEKRIEMVVTNIGSAALSDITFDKSVPVNWDLTFDPKKIDKLQPGKNEKIYVNLKTDKKAIAGDYIANIEAKTPEASAKITYRISVETPTLLGWLGIIIIAAALGSVYYLFRRYGRR
jgi:uncharacterized membrane protein